MTALHDRATSLNHDCTERARVFAGLQLADLRPDIITFADLVAEKPPTLDHVDRMNQVLAEWGWDPIITVRKRTLPDTGYSDLYGNCMVNETLPSLAFGMKSCSFKWKQKPQDQAIKGVKSGPNASPPHPIWLKAQARGERIVKLLGYDCGRADMRRSRNLPTADADFDYAYPLQILCWDRAVCIDVISAVLGPDMVPIKSACFFCPASKIWELYWLAAHHPELLERALLLERNALTGRHSRFSKLEFGATWDEMVRSADRFPSTTTTVGLGRSFAWNQWARVNDVVDVQFRVRRGTDDRVRFLELSDQRRRDDNALDMRHRPDNDTAAQRPMPDRREGRGKRNKEKEGGREKGLPHARRIASRVTLRPASPALDPPGRRGGGSGGVEGLKNDGGPPGPPRSGPTRPKEPANDPSLDPQGLSGHRRPSADVPHVRPPRPASKPLGGRRR